MKFLTAAFALIVMASVHAQEKKSCLEKVRENLKTETELYLYEKQRAVADHFILDCKDTDFGNSVDSQDTFVFVHEAAHFEDLGMGGSNVDPNDPAVAFNLYTVNNEHIGNFQSYKNLPKIKDVIIPYLEKEKQELLKEDSVYGLMHFTYIGAGDAIAADILQGMATELNGYTHGAITQMRVLKKLPNPVQIKDESGSTFTIDNPYSNQPTQIDGILYFVYNFNLYLRLLKEKYPDHWKEFYTDYNKQYLKKLLTPSLETLKKMDHCSLKNSFGPIDYYVKEFLKDDMSVLEDVLGKEKVQELICSKTVVESGLKLLEHKEDASCNEI